MGDLTDLSVNMDFGTHSGQESLVLFVHLFRLAVTSAELQQPYKGKLREWNVLHQLSF